MKKTDRKKCHPRVKPSRANETQAASVKRVVDRSRAHPDPETIAALDPTATDPADVLPDPLPPKAHGWTFTGTLQRQPDGTDRWVGQHIARPSSPRRAFEARVRCAGPGSACAAAHILDRF